MTVDIGSPVLQWSKFSRRMPVLLSNELESSSPRSIKWPSKVSINCSRMKNSYWRWATCNAKLEVLICVCVLSCIKKKLCSRSICQLSEPCPLPRHGCWVVPIINALCIFWMSHFFKITTRKPSLRLHQNLFFPCCGWKNPPNWWIFHDPFLVIK